MVEFETSGDRLAATGSLDADAEMELRAGLRQLLDGDADILTIDLSRVEMITSVCIGVLVAVCIDVRSAGKKMKIAPSPAVKKVLDMTGLTAMLLG